MTKVLSQHYHVAVIVLSGGYLHDSVQDYCIRHAPTTLSWGCHHAVRSARANAGGMHVFPWCGGAPPGAVLGVRLEGRGQVAERFVEAGRLVEGGCRALPQRLHRRQRLAILPAAMVQSHGDGASLKCDSKDIVTMPPWQQLTRPAVPSNVRAPPIRQALFRQLLPVAAD